MEKRGKGKPRLSLDSVRRQITMTIELAIWRQFEQKCAENGVTQAEVFRGLIHAWVEEKSNHEKK